MSLPHEPETFIVSPLVPVGGSVMLYGAPKLGKSYLALQLAAAMTAGDCTWLGFPVTRKARVVYVQFDTPRPLWRTRIDALMKEGICLDEVYFIDRESLGVWPFNILDERHFHTLKAALGPFQPDVVFIDTLKESNTAPENDSTEQQKVISLLQAVVSPATLILIHHDKKPNPEYGGSITTNARGSSYFIGKMDTILELHKKSLGFIGRGIEEGSIKIERDDNGFFEAATEDTDRVISDLMANRSNDESLRAIAKKLAVRINRSEDAARGLIRRWMEAQKARPTPDPAASPEGGRA